MNSPGARRPRPARCFCFRPEDRAILAGVDRGSVGEIQIPRNSAPEWAGERETTLPGSHGGSAPPHRHLRIPHRSRRGQCRGETPRHRRDPAAADAARDSAPADREEDRAAVSPHRPERPKADAPPYMGGELGPRFKLAMALRWGMLPVVWAPMIPSRSSRRTTLSTGSQRCNRKAGGRNNRTRCRVRSSRGRAPWRSSERHLPGIVAPYSRDPPPGRREKRHQAGRVSALRSALTRSSCS